jgi:tetratricopeptide (TPR) repeat protein
LLDLLASEPDDLFLNYALGIEYAGEVSSQSQAENQFKKVLALNAQYIAAYYQMGKLLEAQSRITEALEYLKAGLGHALLKKDNKSVNEFNEAIFMLEE